ncbi:MAG: 50S ribosomal protein L9 [Prevotellaceae bacterium]|nr:50S ribosomal protein L9 [Prevotellaceae bacterium]
MELILKEDVIGLGYKNDIVNVKPGYGRNYLIPKKMAILATESAKKVHAENLRQQAQKLAKIKAQADESAAKLDGVSLVIALKVSSSGTTYGSVSATHIAEELKKKGFDIDRKRIVVGEVKALGHYTATVHLHKEVAVEIPFEVVEEKVAEEEKPEAEPVAEVSEPVESEESAVEEETPAEEPAAE